MRIAILTLLVVTLSSFSVQTPAAEVPQLEPGKGLVVFYRLKSFKGGAIRFNVQHSQGIVGQLGNGTFIYRHLEPGQHPFWSQVISQDSISITVEEGKTYFVRGDVQVGAFAGRPKFTLVSENQGKNDLGKL